MLASANSSKTSHEVIADIMCGIAGIVRFDGGPVAPELLSRMAGALAHRGPDGEGVYVDGPVGLSHRRLAIIDPAGGHQPYIDGPVSLTYNGEIYNYVELAQELGRPDLTCDTHVVTAAYRRWGIDCVTRFRGMFAFALYDGTSRTLYLVRDRLGIKPLFFARVGQSAVFGSEIHALAASGIVALEPDRSRISEFLRDGYVAAPATAFAGIGKLPAATVRTVDVASGRTADDVYWTPAASIVVRQDAAAVEELDALLDEITSIYVRSDVAFGAFLSGGIDSGLVTEAMSRRLDAPVRAFTVDFDEATHSEAAAAKLTAQSVGADHALETLTPSVSTASMEEIAFRLGEPFADSSALPTRLVSKVAARQVKMVLSGDGGDELFGGYVSYGTVAQRMGQPPGLFDRLMGRLGAQLGAGKYSAGLRWKGAEWPDVHRMQRDYFADHERASLMPDLPIHPAPRLPVAPDPVMACQMDDLNRYLPEDILTKVDRMSMAESLEVRVPLLDHRLVEFALTLPLAQRLEAANGGYSGKMLLRRLARGRLPAEIVDRRKMGFGIPIVAWTRGPLRPSLLALCEPSARLAGFVELAQVKRLVGGYLAGDDSLIAKVWALLALELWLAALPRMRSLAS
jgi:asparagine synthase (glutamine-hydrolysing)